MFGEGLPSQDCGRGDRGSGEFAAKEKGEAEPDFHSSPSPQTSFLSLSHDHFMLRHQNWFMDGDGRRWVLLPAPAAHGVREDGEGGRDVF